MDAMLRHAFDLMARGLAEEMGLTPLPTGAREQLAAEVHHVERRAAEIPSLALAAALEATVEDAAAPLWAIPVERKGA